MRSGAARFGLSLAPEAIETLKADARFVVTDLRSIAVQGLVAPDHLPPLAEAKALLHWHARHRFCANCGHSTNIVQGGWRRDCPQCHYQHFPRTDPVVIMLAVRGDQCLLGRQSRFGTGMWSCLAGFVEPGETIEEAARRETLEEAGIVLRARALFRLAALAVSVIADDRLPRRGDLERDQGGLRRTGGCALVHARARPPRC